MQPLIRKRRWRLRSGWVGLSVLALVAGSAQAEVATPTGLHAEVYSRTAAELFWDRPTAGGLRYKVTRDGALLSTLEGTSFFDDMLTAATTYMYAVRAIANDGEQSAPATVTVTTRSETSVVVAPTGLRADVYSRTAIELFWDRPATPGLDYDIERDGVSVSQTSGVSFFDDTLTAGVTYHYAVMAIDPAGARSSAAEIQVTTSGDRSPDESPTSLQLIAPAIDQIAVYSGTAAELFWARPPVGSPIAQIEISRDGIVLGTTDGTSFFDDTRSPGEDYIYTLVAIAADGTRSDGGASDPGDTDSGLDAIRADNAIELLAEIFDAYRGVPWGRKLITLPGYSHSPVEFPFDDLVLTCDNGGSATVIFYFVGSPEDRRYRFDDCLDGEVLFNGDFEDYDYVVRNLVSETGLTVEYSAESVYYQGHMRLLNDGGGREWFSIEPVTFTWQFEDGTVYALSGSDLDFTYGWVPKGPPFEVASLRGTLELSSTGTGGHRLSIEALEPFDRPPLDDPEGGWLPLPEDWTFTEGTLQASAPDGSTLLLEAGNGDEMTATLTVTGSDQRETRWDQPWSVWQVNLRYESE